MSENQEPKAAPKLDIISEDMRAHDDAVRLLEEALAQVTEDDEVEGVWVVIQRRRGMLLTKASISLDIFRRIGLLEVLKRDLLEESER